MKVNKIINILKQGEGEKIEFKSSVSNLSHDICAFLNTEGGIVLVGIDDHGNIIGIKNKQKQKVSDILAGIEPIPNVKIEKIKIENTEIFIIKIAKSNKLHSVGNRIYIRLGANNRPLCTQEIIEKAGESIKILFDELPNIEAKLQNIDKDKVKLYLQQREKLRGIRIKGSLEENMRQIKIIRDYRSKIQPTNAGILFFGKSPQALISYSKVRLVNFRDEEMREYKDSKEFVGALDQIIDQAQEYWAKNLAKIGGMQIKFKREEFFEYPINSLREALINALIHRNYFDPTEIRIFMFPNKIVIKNPGSFPPGITPEHPEHKPRNPLLAQFMYDLGYTEKYGSGIIKIKQECQDHPLVNVYFHLKPFMTEIEFKKEKELKMDQTNQKIITYLTGDAKKSSEIAKFIGLSKQTTLTRLQSLLAVGLIRAQGKGPEIRYKLKA